MQQTTFEILAVSVMGVIAISSVAVLAVMVRMIFRNAEAERKQTLKIAREAFAHIHAATPFDAVQASAAREYEETALEKHSEAFTQKQPQNEQAPKLIKTSSGEEFEVLAGLE